MYNDDSEPPLLRHPLLSSKPAFPAESWMIPSGCISVTSKSAHPKRISSSLPFSPYTLLFLSLLSYVMASWASLISFGIISSISSTLLTPSTGPIAKSCWNYLLSFGLLFSLRSLNLPTLSFTWTLHWPSYWPHPCVSSLPVQPGHPLPDITLTPWWLPGMIWFQSPFIDSSINRPSISPQRPHV